MAEFIQALTHHEFLQNALLASMLASIACGISGTYVVVKRIGYLAGGISHAVLGGVGAAVFFGQEPTWGALLAAAVTALLVGWIHLRARQNEDTLISAVWAVGMAAGILLISQTKGYGVDRVFQGHGQR
ncbi:MAG: metal ABC transporter permease [Thermodesulfobacteriota bacterium]